MQMLVVPPFSGLLAKDITFLFDAFIHRNIFVIEPVNERKTSQIAIHAPFDTGRSGYYNIPNFWMDGI